MQSTKHDADKGVGTLLDEQKRLEARYEQLLVATKKIHHNPMDPALDAQCFAHVENAERKAQFEELQRISAQMKEQSKLLCRQLKENPNDADNWKKIVSERSELIALLSSCVRELTSSAAASFTGQSSDGVAAASYDVFARKVLDEQSAVWADDLSKGRSTRTSNSSKAKLKWNVSKRNESWKSVIVNERVKTELRALEAK